MASSGNFCTLNPLAELGTSNDASTRAGSMSDGNLKYVNLTGNTAVGNFGVTSGKWYYEVYVSSFNSDNGMIIGWANDLYNLDAELGYNSPGSPTGGQAFGLYSQNQTLLYGPSDGSTNSSYGSGTPTNGDIIRIWLDADNGRFWGGLNGTIHSSGDPSAGTGHGFGTGGSPHNIAISSRTLYPAIGNWSAADATVIFNFGQDSSFQGAITAGTETDGNGFGNFKYSTDGFLALCTANLPISEDIDPAKTDDDYPAKQFGAVTYTGNSPTGQAITGLGFKPDLVWAKMRNSSQSHFLSDTTRGINKFVFSDITNAEGSTGGYATVYSSFDSDGFTFSTSGSGPNDNSRTYAAHCWRANGGVTASNTSGDINSTTQANTKSGFSIVTYTGNGSVAQSIGHGLSSGAPEFIIVKNRSQADAWAVYHVGTGNAAHLILDTSAAQTTSSAYWGSFTPTTTLFKVGSDHKLNASGENYVAYLWHGVEGYSKFGTYIGNGDSDGTFVYTGFRPRMVFCKSTTSAEHWVVADTARSTFNKVDKITKWNNSNSEASGDTYAIDIVANGFKIKTNWGGLNEDNVTFIYGAWGDVPFKYNNSF